ncbi:MAG: ATP-binding cassette domain-containing protein [Gordonibacter pamelaeae]
MGRADPLPPSTASCARPGAWMPPWRRLRARNLSGGQRQRLAMARALLHDAPVYLLDEATSNIDAESEAPSSSLCTSWPRTKTVIMISHRLSALRDADCIYVLEDGRVAESGPHDDLVAGVGAYAASGSSKPNWKPSPAATPAPSPTAPSRYPLSFRRR